MDAGKGFEFSPGISKLFHQVAAVCYRRTGASIEFLLVLTNSGKWTFPKGCTSPFRSESKAAKREALEEAGATGKVEDKHFCLYAYPKQLFGLKPHEVFIRAYLLEVRRTDEPAESFRKPAWCTPDEAKKKLAKDRSPYYATQLHRVIDRAVERLAGLE